MCFRRNKHDGQQRIRNYARNTGRKLHDDDIGYLLSEHGLPSPVEDLPLQPTDNRIPINKK